jgi:hypothetical protein
MQGDAVEIEDADWRGRGHVEVAPGKLVYSGYNKKKRALQIWQINVERTAER